MPDRLREVLAAFPGWLSATAAAVLALTSAVVGVLTSRRTARADVLRKEAEADAAAAEAEKLEHEAYGSGIRGLKELTEYFQGLMKPLLEENLGLKRRVAVLEGQILRLDAAHKQCEETTAGLRTEVARLQGLVASPG